jgi:hypothetical protein
MSTQYLADNVGADGTVYPTVGEHIRNAKGETVTTENIISAIKGNTDRAKVCNALDTTASELKAVIVNLLTGKTAYFGGLDCDALTAEELADIKAHLGIV